MTTAASSLWYPVWITDGRKSGRWCWGPPCREREEAAEHLADVMIRRAHSVRLGCVVRAAEGELQPVRDLMVPGEAREVCTLWDRLEAVCEGLDASGHVRWWPVWAERGEWRWGEPVTTPGEARAVIRDNTSPLRTLVCIIDGERRALDNEIRPPSARKIVRHWDALWDCTESASSE